MVGRTQPVEDLVGQNKFNSSRYLKMNGLHHYFIVIRDTVHCPGKDMSLCVTQESLLH